MKRVLSMMTLVLCMCKPTGPGHDLAAKKVNPNHPKPLCELVLLPDGKILITKGKFCDESLEKYKMRVH